MKVSTNTPSKVWYQSGRIQWSNQGPIHLLQGFKGLCPNNFARKSSLPLGACAKSDLTPSLISQLENLLISGINSLAEGSDYMATSTGYHLKYGRILQAPLSFEDQFTDGVNLFSHVADQELTDQELEVKLANPDQLGDEITESNIVEEYDRDGNIVSMVPLNKLEYICKYSVYDYSGAFVKFAYKRGDATERVIEIPKVKDELHKINYVLLRYIS